MTRRQQLGYVALVGGVLGAVTLYRRYVALPVGAERGPRSSLADRVNDTSRVDWARLRSEAERRGWVGGPHCQPGTIHPRGTCDACDAYPDLQARRAVENMDSWA